MVEDKQTIEGALVPLEKYLETGVHIGTRFRSGSMRKFIYKCRTDGLCVLDVSAIDNRIKIASKFISRYEPGDVLVVAGRTYAQRPAEKLAELIGASCVSGRFTPGMLTNPKSDEFKEPKLILIADPPVDRQAIKEAKAARIPIISLCDSSNPLEDIDLVIPSNNKGKKSLAIIYWLLAREILKTRGIIKSDSEFTTPVEDFETKTINEERELGRKEKEPEKREKRDVKNKIRRK